MVSGVARAIASLQATAPAAPIDCRRPGSCVASRRRSSNDAGLPASKIQASRPAASSADQGLALLRTHGIPICRAIDKLGQLSSLRSG